MVQDNLPLERELDRLLDEDISSVIVRENTAFDRLTAPYGKSLVLFGAGHLGRQVLARLRKDGIEPLAFADNNPQIWGKFVDGLEVLSPHVAAGKYGQRATFVVTIWSPGNQHQFKITKQNLHSLNCANIISFLSLMWKYSESFLPNCFLDLPHKIIAEGEDARKAFLLWEDEESRATYISQLKWRMLENFDKLPARNSEKQYFPNFIKLTNNEVFVDCGAYNGDTIKDILTATKANFRFIHSFEPDPLNFNKLSEFVDSLSFKDRIVLYPKAVGARFETLNFSAEGTASSILDKKGTIKVESVPLDEILDNCIPTFIKMDIEGAEIDALKGSKRIIQKTSPVLAICVYHRQNHLWRIPLLISSLSKKYHFFLRAHKEEGWDVVCYAIPGERLIY